MPDTREVIEYLSAHPVTINREANGITIVVYLCEVIDNQGKRCHCDGYETTHRYFDEEYGLTVTPLDQFVEWR